MPLRAGDPFPTRGRAMSECPFCGRENVREPEGYVTLCGRRVAWCVPSDDWRVRMAIAQICKDQKPKAKGQRPKAKK